MTLRADSAANILSACGGNRGRADTREQNDERQLQHHAIDTTQQFPIVREAKGGAVVRPPKRQESCVRQKSMRAANWNRRMYAGPNRPVI